MYGLVLLDPRGWCAPLRDGLSGWRVCAPALAPDDDDGTALRAAQAARAECLAAGAIHVLVAGGDRGGTWALLAAAVLPGFAGAVILHGAVVYPALSAARPSQPLDLLAGLRGPIQFQFGERDPDIPAWQVARLRERLAGLPVASQIITWPVGSGLLDPASPDHRPETASLMFARAGRFLVRAAQAA